ncbi:MAG: 30S ribosomal protein S12 methylthiotransferase RimO [candidate division WOR-3 bacterium]
MIASVISLGCPKNLIDSELILGNLVRAGFILTDSIEKADLVIINTCAFIQPAVTEAKNKIQEILTYKKKGIIQKIFVAGCLVQRFQKNLEKEYPEIDGFFGIDYLHEIPQCWEKKPIKKTFVCTPQDISTSYEPRLLSTPHHYAYLKIADGCDNHCSYCLLPSIRGRYRSREIEDVVREAKMLAKSGVKELILVAQDTTFYGQDRYHKPMLSQLLHKLNQIKSFIWIRLLYTHPAHFNDELIKAIAKLPRVAKYVDLPLQHISDRLLARMNRKVTRLDIERLLTKLRKIDRLVLRTSFIVGFPSETEKDFTELCDFIREQKFDHLGCFTYYQEKGSLAYSFRNQIPEKVKIERFNELMKLQKSISRQLLFRFRGRKVKVLIDALSQRKGYNYVGRTEGDAPEIDGLVYVNGKNIEPGDLVMVEIKKSSAYDLFGEIVSVPQSG